MYTRFDDDDDNEQKQFVVYVTFVNLKKRNKFEPNKCDNMIKQ